MEWVEIIINAITTIGFPIVCVIGLCWFIYKIYTDTNKRHEEQIRELEDRNKEREDRLYEQVEKQNEINGQAIATITLYAEKLDVVQEDVKEIKSILLERK